MIIQNILVAWHLIRRTGELPALVKAGCREAAGRLVQEINVLTSTTPALRATPPQLRRGVLGRPLASYAKPMFVATTMLAMAQAPDVSGRWQTTGVPNGPWIMELQVNGNKVSGNVRQGADGTPVPIYFGSVEGNAITFKVTSPDGDRIITFNGKITRAEIGFGRQVAVRPGGARGDTGIFGGNAVLNFSARRMN